MNLYINLDDEVYNNIVIKNEYTRLDIVAVHNALMGAIHIPRGHGRIVDIGQIDKDRIDHDNPIISLTINGEYIEAVSLDYLDGLQTIIEADKEDLDD